MSSRWRESYVRKGFVILIWTSLASLLLFALLFHDWASSHSKESKEEKQEHACISRLSQISRLTLNYAEDHDDTFPEAEHWMDELSPSADNHDLIQCPVTTQFGYAFHKGLSSKKSSAIANPVNQPLIYDSSTLQRYATDFFTSLPTPPRHYGKVNNVSYADGHVHKVGE